MDKRKFALSVTFLTLAAAFVAQVGSLTQQSTDLYSAALYNPRPAKATIKSGLHTAAKRRAARRGSTVDAKALFHEATRHGTRVK